MSKIEQYYAFIDMFKGNLTKEQQQLLESLEDTVIAEEILPSIKENVTPLLSKLRRGLTLVIEYTPENGVVLNTTREPIKLKERKSRGKYKAQSWSVASSVNETEITTEQESNEEVFDDFQPAQVDGEVVLSCKKGSRFVLDVLTYFYEQYGLEPIMPYIVEHTLVGIKKNGSFNLPGIFLKGSEEEMHLRNGQDEHGNSENPSRQRWFETPFLLDTDTVYLSTQWKDTKDCQGLTIDNFERMIQECFDNGYGVRRDAVVGYQLIMK